MDEIDNKPNPPPPDQPPPKIEVNPAAQWLPAEESGCRPIGSLLAGGVLGFLVTLFLIGPLCLAMLLSFLNDTSWAEYGAIFSFLVSVGAFAMAYRTIRAKPRRQNHFLIGVLMGICISTLLQGACYAFLGPIRPG